MERTVARASACGSPIAAASIGRTVIRALSRRSARFACARSRSISIRMDSDWCARRNSVAIIVPDLGA
jgi:hypothetical protein